jgi:hypothetical protein
VVDDIPQIEPTSDLYEGCVMVKHHQVSFPKDKVRSSSQYLALIHSDICLLSKYFLTSIDDFLSFLGTRP